MSNYDSIVIGAGHNGLVCAAYLAAKGQRVLVLEAASAPGGLAETREFHPGFRASVAHTISQFSPKVAADLKLARYGYALPEQWLDTVALGDGGDHVVVGRYGVEGVADADANSFLRWREKMALLAESLQPSWLKTMPRIGDTSVRSGLTFGEIGLRLRKLGRDDMLEFLRVATLPMRDLMDENFENKRLQAALAWEGLIGSRMAPRSPNNAVFAMLYRMLGETRGRHTLPAGGVQSLVTALQAAARDAGAELRLGAPVRRVVLAADNRGQRVEGVELDSGEIIGADRVVSSADPQRTFLGLVGARHLEIEFANRIRRLRCEGYVAKLHLALAGLPAFTGIETPANRMLIADDPDALEFAFDDAKYGNWSENPVMEVLIPSLHDPSLAPGGQHVLSAHVMYVPAKLKGGWTDEARAALLDRVLETLESYAPGLRELVLHSEMLTPADLEDSYRVTGGHWHHTEFAVDQMLMMRPTYEAAQYRTPIPGLFLCGAGCHPGGGLVGAAGHNAAREILR